LQEGDGLMAGSRRRENLLRRTFCGTCGKCANPDEFARASRHFSLTSYVKPADRKQDQPMKRPPFQFPRAM
jgi:hypothetical protein